MYRTGQRDLELAYGRFSDWYARSLTEHAKYVLESLLCVNEPREFVECISEPIWFDAFLISIGFDERSSGGTTILGAILKEILRVEDGVLVVGGKSVRRFQVPKELTEQAPSLGLSLTKVENLKFCSRMTAKVDQVAIQDGFSLYHHMMFVSHDGYWAVVQQGKKPVTGMARRYHWYSGKVNSFVEEPHTGIITEEKSREVLDMTAKESGECRKTVVDLLRGELSKIRAAARIMRAESQSDSLDQFTGRVHQLPGRINWKLVERLHLSTPSDFEQLLAVRGVGREIIRMLALASERLLAIRPSWEDPASTPEEYHKSKGGAEGCLKLLEKLLESLEESRMPEDLKRHSLSRLENWLSPNS